jgi:hypothetical protein
MTNRHPVLLVLRMFATVFIIVCLIAMFWNTLSGRDMFPMTVAFWVAVVLTIMFTAAGWAGATVGSKVFLNNDPGHQNWKRRGGRPFWDTVGWPINTATDIERETGIPEPQYTTFVPPASWRYQCPSCGARVEKQIDVCWNCSYGANNDNTAYVKRFGQPPARPKQCSGPSCQPPAKSKPPQSDQSQGWRPVS